MASVSVLYYSVLYLSCIVSFSEAIECSGTAEYTLTFRAEWTRESHANFPPNPHFSPLVGCSHKASYVMWKPGEKASTGVKNVAEFGGPNTLNNEMQQQITLKNAYKKYQGSGISGGTGTSSISNIKVNTEYPLVSFISMIAPSPDWFVGVHDFDLCNTTSGTWLDLRARDLPLYDAGTDSAPTFVHGSGSPTNPPENIALITNNTEGSLKGDKPLKRFGTFTFLKTFDSNPVIQPTATISKNIVGTKTKPPSQAVAQTATVNVMTTPKMTTPDGASLGTKTKPPSQVVTQSAKINVTTTPKMSTPDGASLGTKTKPPSQVVAQTATINVMTTPTPDGASMGTQPGFVHLLFAIILVNLCL